MALPMRTQSRRSAHFSAILSGLRPPSRASLRKWTRPPMASAAAPAMQIVAKYAPLLSGRSPPQSQYSDEASPGDCRDGRHSARSPPANSSNANAASGSSVAATYNRPGWRSNDSNIANKFQVPGSKFQAVTWNLELSFHLIRFVHVHGGVVVVKVQDDRQGDGGLGRGQHHDHQREHLAFQTEDR